MGPIGFPELILIFIVALLVFGPKKLPELGKTIGRAMAEFRRASNDLQRSLEDEIAADELREVKKSVQDAVAIPKEITGLITDTNSAIKSSLELDPYESMAKADMEKPIEYDKTTEPQTPITPSQPIEPK